MVLPVPGEGARGLVSFRLLGIPVSIHASFLFVAFALGAVGQGYDAALVWAVVVTVSVLAHEFGHALTAPRGAEARIDLFGLAGLTRWNAAGTGRLRRVAVSVAGVAGGILLGIGVLGLEVVVDPVRGSLLEYAFDAALFANFGWGLLNLLPMLPLDGGHVVRALMPGRDEVTRDTRAVVVSLLAGAVAIAAALLNDMVIAAAFVVFLSFGNVQLLVALRRLRSGGGERDRLERANDALEANRPAEALELAEGIDHPAARIVAAASLLRLDRPREAQHLLLDLPDLVRLDPTFEATVLLANGQEQLARERLATSLASDPEPWAVRELAALLHRRGEDVEAALPDVKGLAAVGASNALFFEGAYAVSARFAERALGSGVDSPFVAYNAACAWARAGDLDRALRFLDHAALLGFDDAVMVDGDEDLAPLRRHPGYALVRERIGLGAPRARR